MLKEGLSVVLWKGFYLFFLGWGIVALLGLGAFHFPTFSLSPNPAKNHLPTTVTYYRVRVDV